MKILNKLLTIFLMLTALFATAYPASAYTPQSEQFTQVQKQIINDSNSQFVSVEEAVIKFGYNPISQENNTQNANINNQKNSASPQWSWWGCKWHGQADYPHVTRNEASVHGYWVKDSGNCPATANVTVKLQALLCSNFFGCTWITQTTETVNKVKSGSGTGRWATPHKACKTTDRLVAWRGTVEVDLNDFADPFGWDTGKAKDLKCVP